MKKGFSANEEKKSAVAERLPQPAMTGKKDVSVDPKKNIGKSRRKEDTTPLPVLIELSYTVSIIVLILATVSVILVSILTGATLLNLVIRTAVTVVVLGLLLFLISWQIASGTMDAFLIEEEERKKEAAEKAAQEKAQENENAVEAQ